MTDPLGQSQVLPYIKGLSKEGYTFDLISFEKKERFDQHKSTIQAICDENNIDWHPISYTKKPPLLSTIWDVWRMKKKAKVIFKQKQFELIHCRSYISALVGLYFKRTKKIAFLFDMRGFWVDERVDGKLWNLKNPIFKIVFTYFKRKELLFLNYSDKIVSLTENGKEELLTWKNIQFKEDKIKIIPCCVDLALFDRESISIEKKQSIKMELSLSNDDFILGYVGSIGTWYMLDEMLDYFISLLSQKPKARFLFISNNFLEIKTACAAKHIDENKIIIHSCLHSDVPAYISIFDQSIFFIKPSYSKKSSSPTKQAEIMAMGIPLICNDGVGDTSQIVEKYKAGNFVTAFTLSAYLDVQKLEGKFDLQSSVSGAKEYFSLENGVKNYSRIYSEILLD